MFPIKKKIIKKPLGLTFLYYSFLETNFCLLPDVYSILSTTHSGRMGGRVMLVIGALLMLLMTSVDNGVVDGSGVVAGVGYQYHCYWW